MTVKELIELLQQQDPNLQVFFEDEECHPVPVTTVSLSALPIYQPYIDTNGEKKFHFYEGIILWNE